MATFNGHKNWNHWNVTLWILNDERLYQMAKDAIRGWPTKDAAARAMVTELPPATPDGAPYTFTTVRAALRGF
jgi:hypothetical protein